MLRPRADFRDFFSSSKKCRLASPLPRLLSLLPSQLHLLSSVPSMMQMMVQFVFRVQFGVFVQRLRVRSTFCSLVPKPSPVPSLIQSRVICVNCQIELPTKTIASLVETNFRFNDLLKYWYTALVVAQEAHLWKVSTPLSLFHRRMLCSFCVFVPRESPSVCGLLLASTSTLALWDNFLAESGTYVLCSVFNAFSLPSVVCLLSAMCVVACFLQNPAFARIVGDGEFSTEWVVCLNSMGEHSTVETWVFEVMFSSSQAWISFSRVLFSHFTVQGKTRASRRL